MKYPILVRLPYLKGTGAVPNPSLSTGIYSSTSVDSRVEYSWNMCRYHNADTNDVLLYQKESIYTLLKL